MDELQTSLRIVISVGGKALAYVVGGFILTSFSLLGLAYINLRHSSRTEFKRVFGKFAKQTSSEEVNRKISVEYDQLLALEKRVSIVRAKMEIEQLDKQISECRERIQDMNRLAKVNQFVLSYKNLEICNLVERQIVKYSAPTAA